MRRLAKPVLQTLAASGLMGLGLVAVRRLWRDFAGCREGGSTLEEVVAMALYVGCGAGIYLGVWALIDRRALAGGLAFLRRRKKAKEDV
jgi:hypothetical protein